MTLRHAIEPGVILFILSAVIVLFSAARIERFAPAPDPFSPAGITPADRPDEGRSRAPERSGTASAKRNRIYNIARAVFFLVGLAAIGYSVFLVATQKVPSFSLESWLLGLILCFIGMCFYSSFPWRLPRRRREIVELAFVIFLVALAVASRFPHLSEIPADVHGDEGAVGLEARRILTGTVVNLFGLGWAGLPELSFAPSALTMRLFGDNLFGLRLASVIEGTASVVLIYGVAKRLFTTRVAVIAALILATSQMAVHYSRIGNNYITALFVSLLFFYFLLRGLARDHPVDFLVAGYAAGMAVSVYYPARVTLVLGIVYVVHRAIGEREFLRRHRSGPLVLALGFCVFFAPQVVQYVRDPMSAFLRTSSVFVLKPNNLGHELNAYGVTTVGAVLWRQFVDSIGAFNLLGETSRQYGQQGPLFDFWSGALFVLGVALVTARPRSARYLLLASWVWVSVIVESALTVDAMFSPHVIAILAVTPILPALILDLGWRGAAARFGAWGHRVAAVGAIAFVAATSYANYVDYFVV
ncbi:MAG TPA: glycosyltransferase family 39 protein, partial [Chloroflexota bacterium]|nr:glycosyltransferase family 39 protein [Chloroflexota bacterium]